MKLLERLSTIAFIITTAMFLATYAYLALIIRHEYAIIMPDEPKPDPTPQPEPDQGVSYAAQVIGGY